jgi:hypothetical protein
MVSPPKYANQCAILELEIQLYAPFTGSIECRFNKADARAGVKTRSDKTFVENIAAD